MDDELAFQIEKIRQVVYKDNDIRDNRIKRWESQMDSITSQLSELTLQNRDILAHTTSSDERMKDFTVTMNKYIDKHDLDHQMLKATDEQLKKYMYLALGGIAIISFIAPYVWQIIWASSRS